MKPQIGFLIPALPPGADAIGNAFSFAATSMRLFILMSALLFLISCSNLNSKMETIKVSKGRIVREVTDSSNGEKATVRHFYFYIIIHS
jgi:hypothetical protein